CSGALAQQLKPNQEDPCKVKGRVVGDVTYCDRYWECVNNQPELYDCPNGLVFAGKHRGVTEGCDYPWRANYCEDKQMANGPISTEHCDWLYGIFGHETSCTRYWTCWNGTATEQLCIGGLLYNENAHSCDWPENVDGCQKH
ncbi:protein obstructor-E-like, partial [Musca vetustissima]